MLSLILKYSVCGTRSSTDVSLSESGGGAVMLSKPSYLEVISGRIRTEVVTLLALTAGLGVGAVVEYLSW